MFRIEIYQLKRKAIHFQNLNQKDIKNLYSEIGSIYSVGTGKHKVKKAEQIACKKHIIMCIISKNSTYIIFFIISLYTWNHY